MEVILLGEIQNLGGLGDLVNVKPGYARNYLIPYGKAVWATDAARVKVEDRRKELAKLEEERLDIARAKAELLPETLTVSRKASEEGKLYGSVSPSDLAELLQQSGVNIARSEVSLPGGPIKELGESQVEILLHPEIRNMIMVKVIEEL